MLTDPPLPTRTTSVTEMSSDEARKTTYTVVAIGAVFVIIALLLWSHSKGWAVIFGLVGLGLMIGAFGKKSLITACPYCQAQIGGILRDKASQIVRCSSCFEYSIVEARRTRALDPNSTADKPRYWSPAFEGAVWPEGCVECGAPPTRRDSVRDTSMKALALVVGMVWVQRASLSNVPYCDAHKDAVELSYSQNKKMDLRWKSLRMMRHYLAANRGKEMLGSKNIINP